MSAELRRPAKAPPRASPTSDVTRVRAALLAALGAAVGCGVALAAGAAPIARERPLARPHAAAKVACAKCHAPPPAASASASASSPRAPAFAAAGACKACHGAAEHASTRPAHRALAANGRLACATCHPPHEGAQGVTFAGDEVVRWGAGAARASPASAHPGAAGVKPKTTAPIVALSVCARCHDVSSAADPASRCVSADARRAAPAALATTPSLCFDEHRSAANAGARFVAWDAAREVATSTAWVAPPPRAGGPWAPLGAAFAGASLLGAGGLVLARRRAAPRTATPKPAAPAARKRLPVIDPTTCLGCYACVDACPFDVLTIEKYVAVVARPEECCGVVLCEQVCPNGSLAIAEGEPVLDRPAVDEHLESKDVPGLFVAGDLTGLPLIKNAINQGVCAMDRVAATLPRRRRGLDVVVIGAGPAGLAAGLRAEEKGLSCVVLEQSTIAASIRSFPRDKLVYDPPLDLPVEGALCLKEATKEELLAQWTRIVRARRLDVREGRRVTAIARDGDGFVVSAEGASGAESHAAARVIVAIGRRGTPRTLDVEVEPGAEGRVSYALADARSFAGKRVLVVGLGDSAMEAAVALARQPGTTVAISYRGAGFRRGKARNIAELQALVAKGRVRVHFETVPVAVTRSGVVLHAARGRRTVAADAVLVLVGGEPSWDLLVRAGVRRPGTPSRDR